MPLSSVADCLEWVISFDTCRVREEVLLLRCRFPQATTYELAEQAYASIMSQVSPAAKIAHVIGLADQITISPWTVIGQVNKYAESAGQPQIQLSKSAFPGAVTNFNCDDPSHCSAAFSAAPHTFGVVAAIASLLAALLVL